ncbi:ABC transporter ATP-binding protein [Alkalihalobacillus pseudalcaliphilus]|uniref:ABC transporter ATP-binding protein n=1 Tax=Alkalihalobacillus pseudalcaliphilus TaxID=79884 RepID=UPI00064DD631|nr:ABC transporter ATP-binding protein [Alkalihalobacillus pseudalcaliphilus]KMK78094.1 ABC transporter ATP-binding protein [Alkalihalobacillus pseudalcaliphilus]
MIEIQGLSKSYGTKKALEQVSITIKPGTCFGLVGPNGAGKSTLMKILSGILKEYDGKVSMFEHGEPSLGYVPQDICLEETVSAQSNLSFFGEVYGLKGKELAERIDVILEDIGLLERKKDKVHTFSGGMKRRLNIGCALLHSPEVIILDEPTVGVDPQSRRHIFELIHKLKNEGKTIIYASHYMEEIESLCDQVAFIDQGRVVEHGTVIDLLKKYAKHGVYIKAELPEGSLPYENMYKKDGGTVILTEQPLEELKKIAEKCQAMEVVPSHLSLMQPRLEDVFFTLTGTELRDKSA